MAATAVIEPTRRETPPEPEVCGTDALGLAFDVVGGPIAAVCGLTGGAGVSTFSYLLSACAARESRAPVLVCDTGGPTGGLCSYTKVASRRSLSELSELVAKEEALRTQIFAETPTGLRVIATEPKFREDVDSAGLTHILETSRQSHGLTVIDCGTLQRRADQLVLAMASHVVWFVPASESALRRAAQTLSMVLPCEAREIVVARAEAKAARASLRALEAIARSRNAPLVLMPQIPDLATDPWPAAAELAQVPLAALAALLHR